MPLASNICQMGHVQRLVTVLQRVWRVLSEEDQERYAERFGPYLQGHAGHDVYRLGSLGVWAPGVFCALMLLWSVCFTYRRILPVKKPVVPSAVEVVSG